MIINAETYIKKFPQKPKFISWICIRGYVTITMNFIEDNKKIIKKNRPGADRFNGKFSKTFKEDMKAILHKHC